MGSGECYVTKRVYTKSDNDTYDDQVFDVTIGGIPSEATGYVIDASTITKLWNSLKADPFHSSDNIFNTDFIYKCTAFAKLWDSIKFFVPGAELKKIEQQGAQSIKTYIHEGGGMFYNTRIYEFCAGHILTNPGFSKEENKRIYGKCNRYHGHNFKLFITVESDEKKPFYFTSKELDAIVEADVIDYFDHHTLNDLEKFKDILPTTENFTKIIWSILEQKIKYLYCVTIRETSKNVFHYYGGDENANKLLIIE